MEGVQFTNGVDKKVIHAGKLDVPDFKDGSKVIFHFKTQTIDKDGELKDIIDDSRNANRPMEIILGKQFKMPIWEKCLKSMRIEEVAVFRVEKNLIDAYPLVSKSFREFAGISKSKKGHCCGMMAFTEGVGHNDLDNLIRSPSELAFTFELLKVELPGDYEKESWSMEPEEKLQSIPELKNIGNELYKNNEYDKAAKNYAEALGRLEQLILREKPGDEEWVSLNNLKIPIMLNYAQCKLLQKEYYPTIEYTTQVLDNDKDNVKALYRRAKAYVGIWDLELAKEDLLKVSELDPSFQKVVQKELRNINLLQKQKDDELKSKLLGKV